jgi:ribosomal-protein-alanine N-acetyltransferase
MKLDTYNLSDLGHSQNLNISISQATLEDLEGIIKIEQVSFTTPWSRKSFEAELQGNEFSVTLAARSEVSPEHNKLLVGYICFWLVFDELRFLTLAVTSKLRRRGIASKLVARAIDLGFAKGTQRGLLEVRESNQAAQALYRKLGFKVYAKRKSYYTNPDEDAILMSLDPLSGSIAEVSK